MSFLKFMLLMPLMIFSCAGGPLLANEPNVIYLENAKVISVERGIPGSGVIHWLAVITVSTPQKDTTKLYVSYFGEQQVFPAVGSLCTIDAKKQFIDGIPADNISITDQLLLVPTSIQCDGKMYPPKTLSMTKACNSELLNYQNATAFFEKSKLTPVTSWHYHYIASPCKYSGQVAYKGDIWDFYLYPTGYGALSNKALSNESIFFTCYDCGVLMKDNLTHDELP